jgi:hypothetical protein
VPVELTSQVEVPKVADERSMEETARILGISVNATRGEF